MPSKSLDYLEGLVGDAHVTVEDLVVERGKVTEFARSIGDDAAADPDGGPAGVPLTFTRTAFFPRYRPDELADVEDFGATWGFDIGFDTQYTMHAEQTYEFERPLEVGDRLTGETTLTDVFQRGGDDRTMTFAVFETEYRDEADDLVVTGRATNVEVLPAEADDA